ncbi:hypothetical protein COTS27_01092 [Spirochaetota bacterium]|nr:hypothetical protein COTS27_01092 [Spirochaetota bacterium]
MSYYKKQHKLNPRLMGRGVLIVGGGLMQVPLIERALMHNMRVHVIDMNENAPGVALIPKENFIHASIGDKMIAQRSLLRHLEREISKYQTQTRPLRQKNYHHELNSPPQNQGITATESPLSPETEPNVNNYGHIECVLTVGTDYTATVAILNETLKSFYKKATLRIDQSALLLPNVKHLSVAEAITASHKVQMRKRLAQYDIAQPKFFPLETNMISSIERTVLEAEKFLGAYPYVLKPVDAMGARGVKRIEDRDVLLKSLSESLAYSHLKTLILEEYLSGAELSIDAIIANGEVYVRGIAERKIEYPPYFVETGHMMPCMNISEQEITVAISQFKKAIRALNIVTGAAKGDIKLSGGTAYIGEIAARLSGGFMSGWTTALHLGVDMMQAILEVSFALTPTTLDPLPESDRSVVCEWALLPGTGEIKEIAGITAARAIPGVADLFIHIKEGDTLHSPENNLMKAGNVIIQAATLAENQQIFKRVNETLRFIFK